MNLDIDSLMDLAKTAAQCSPNWIRQAGAVVEICDCGSLATIDLHPLHPIKQRLRRSADLGRYRGHRSPALGMLAFVIPNETHRASTHFGRKLVCRIAHDGSIPFGVWSLQQTRDGSFDQILQIAAVRTDADMNTVDAAADNFTLRARRLPWIVPSPSAMLVTRLTPSDLAIQRLSSYELLGEVTRRFEAWSPAAFIGHNTIRFDEELLRHGLFAALQDSYVTQLNCDLRTDTLIMLHAVHLLAPDCITIPTVAVVDRTGADASADTPTALRVRPSFRLGDIARANGISLDEADAHDALADVKATIEIATLIRAKMPDIFSMMLTNASKAHVLDQLNQPWQQQNPFGMTRAQEAATACGLNHAVFLAPEDLSVEPELIELLLRGHVFGPSAKLTPILFIGMLPENKNAAIVVDLTVDPDDWLHCDTEALSSWME
jgi:DNA polymerase III epsilon subunit-like protein